MRYLILTLSLILGLATSVGALDPETSVRIFKYGEIIYSAPLRDINGKVIDRSAFYHVLLKNSVTGAGKGIYICDVFAAYSIEPYTECRPSSGQ